MEHFDVRPKAAAEAELRSGVERWKVRNPKYKSYYPTKSRLPAELARELEQRQSAADATTPAAPAEPKANGSRQERQAFAQLRQTPEYKAVASHEIRRAAFVEGVRLAVRGDPLGAWRKQHPWQRYVHTWAVEGHATACRLYGLAASVVTHDGRAPGVEEQ